jgi:hypothetical protein
MPVIPETTVPDPVKQKALNAKIDAAIAELERALRAKRDRRGPEVAHDPERRGGFDRRDKLED